ncbi:MAG: BatA domain-containing protein [Flavobacteriales bacterium]|jgi:hypothetical protein|nr:BatA domain-containing protein [Flavobacteriales bacterium]
MKLLYPEFLWGLLAIILPIIIHLFNFKKFKKEYFSNVNILKEVKLETQHRSQLKHLLILATRIGAIALLVLAFCQPYFESGQNIAAIKNTIGIYIDNSLSMDSKKNESYLIDEAKDAAVKLVESYSPTDQYQLLTNDFEGKHQRIVNQEEAIELIEEIEISSSNKTLKELYIRQSDLMKNQKNNKTTYWLSDFSRNNFDITTAELDSTMKVNVVPFQQELNENVYIDSVWFESPLRQINQEEELFVRVVNSSENEIGVKLNLKINNEIKSIVNEKLAPQATKVTQLNYAIQIKGLQFGEVYLSDYPNPNLTFDDRFFFTYNIKEKSKVLHIKESERGNFNPVETVFQGDQNFEMTTNTLSEVDYASLTVYDLVIIENLSNFSNGLQLELKKFIEHGGSLLIIPDATINRESYNAFFAAIDAGYLADKEQKPVRIGTVNQADKFYDNVFDKVDGKIDLPIVDNYYPLSYKTKVASKVLLKLSNDVPFFSYLEVGKGKCYFLAAPLENSSFIEHALFVPTILKVAENSQLNFALYHTIGEKGLLNVANTIKEGNLFIREEKSDYEFIPEYIQLNNAIALDVHDKIQEAGHYNLISNQQSVMPLAYNHNRSESVVDYYNSEKIMATLEKKGWTKWFTVFKTNKNGQEQAITTSIEKVKYWKYFVLGALFLLLLEIVLIRFFRVK